MVTKVLRTIRPTAITCRRPRRMTTARVLPIASPSPTQRSCSSAIPSSIAITRATVRPTTTHSLCHTPLIPIPLTVSYSMTLIPAIATGVSISTESAQAIARSMATSTTRRTRAATRLTRTSFTRVKSCCASSAIPTTSTSVSRLFRSRQNIPSATWVSTPSSTVPSPTGARRLTSAGVSTSRASCASSIVVAPASPLLNSCLISTMIPTP